MPSPPPRTERGLRERQAEADQRMRRAQWAAYVQATLAAFVAVIMAVQQGDALLAGFYALLAMAVAVLGWMVGRHRSALAAGLLLALILGGAVYQLVTEERPPALLVVAIFAWIYGQALQAAREYSQLHVVPLEADPPAT